MNQWQGESDDDDDDDEAIKAELKARTLYQPPVFWLPEGRVVFENHSLSGKQLHAHCRKHGISLPIPEGVNGFVTVSQRVAFDANLIGAMHTSNY